MLKLILSGLALGLVSLTLLFVVSALCLRFSVTWAIDIFSWYREVLNNLAGAVGA